MKGRVIALDEIAGRKAAALIVDGVLQDVLIDPVDDTPLTGAIYRAVGDRPMKGMGGMFVKLPGGETGFLRQTDGIAPGQRLLVHVIATDCSCAQRLTRHLLQRPRLAGTVEVLLLVGPDAAWQPLAEAAGVAIHRVDAATLQQRYGLDAAPVLVALAPGGRIDYLGGYFDHPAALHPLDESIHARWAGGAGAPAALPVYGCAVSDSLRRSIDPLGVLDGPHRPQ